ncbi:MAG: MFS transporter [Kiloniellales bacterium]
MRDIGKASRRPRRFARATGVAASQGFRAASPAARDAGASPHHALLAENPGKPSLWVIISAPWYQIPVGMAVDRWGPRRVLTAAGFCALGSLCFALSESLGLLYLGRLMIGVGSAFGFVGALTLAGRWFAPHRFALVSGLTMMAGMSGGILGQAPLAVIIDAAGWRAPLLGAALLIGWALGAPLAGQVSDRRARRKPALIAATGGGLACLGALIYLPGLPGAALALLVFVTGLFLSAMVVCFAIAREINTGAVTGAALAFVNMMVVGAGALLQPLIEALLDLNWDGALTAGAPLYSPEAYRAAFSVLVIFPIAGLGAAFLVRETRASISS